MASLDYSSSKPSDADAQQGRPVDLSTLVDENSRGVRGKDGLYEVRDVEFGGDDNDDDDDEEDDIIARAINGTALGKSAQASDDSPAVTSRFSTIGGLFSRLTGSKVLTKQDLEPVLAGMKEHLMKKNVAQEIAGKVCEGVGESLVGKKVSGFKGKTLVLVVFFGDRPFRLVRHQS